MAYSRPMTLRECMEAEEPGTVCEWKEEDAIHMPNTFATSCGELWSFIEGGIKENGIRFCHGCGNPVMEMPSAQGDAK